MSATSQLCEECGKRPARGGHRFCYACIGQALSQPQPPARLPQQSSITYPLPKKQR